MDAVVSSSHDTIRKGSRSFALASRLFDRATREHAWMLYAWCRHCDDEIDGQELGMTPVVPSRQDCTASLARLRSQTQLALAGGELAEPVFVAFQRVARRCSIPEKEAMEFLAGFEMDVTRFRYQSLDDTLLYCHRVAGVVGVMMARVMGVTNSGALQRAADLGIAFQLTNIARDVIDDDRNSRCYLPADWLAEAGIPRDAVSAAEHRIALAGVVHRLLAEADRYYASSVAGLPALGFRSAWAVATALGVYRDIGRVVRRRGPRGWDHRAVVGGGRKILLLSGGALRAVQAISWGRWRPAAPRDADLWTPLSVG